MSATPRRTCPRLTTGTIKTGLITEAGSESPSVTLTPIQCLGPSCHFWMHDNGAPPETGDCVDVLSARFAAIGAGQMQLSNENLATLGKLIAHVAKAAGVNVATTTDVPSPPTA